MVIDNHSGSKVAQEVNTKGLEFQETCENSMQRLETSNQGDSYGGDLNEWVTPEALLANLSNCQIVGNKFKSFCEDESQHSKWEEFRRMAKSETTDEECSQLLRRMELQDSDEEQDVDMDDLTTLEKEDIQADKMVEDLEKKRPKRQRQWVLSKEWIGLEGMLKMA